MCPFACPSIENFGVHKKLSPLPVCLAEETSTSSPHDKRHRLPLCPGLARVVWSSLACPSTAILRANVPLTSSFLRTPGLPRPLLIFLWYTFLVLPVPVLAFDPYHLKPPSVSILQLSCLYTTTPISLFPSLHSPYSTSRLQEVLTLCSHSSSHCYNLLLVRYYTSEEAEL